MRRSRGTGSGRRRGGPRLLAMALPAILAAGVVVGLAACSEGGDGAVGTVVVGVRSDFSGLNPVTNTSIDTDQVL